MEVNGEYLHPGCVPSSMYPEDPGTVVARSCHQRGVDEKIGDASPIRDSANLAKISAVYEYTAEPCCI